MLKDKKQKKSERSWTKLTMVDYDLRWLNKMEK